jgi:hypothetical protein
MAHDSWTASDPPPDDFGADITAIDPCYVEAHVGNPDAKLTIVVGVEDEDARWRSSSPHAATSGLPK